MFQTLYSSFRRITKKSVPIVVLMVLGVVAVRSQEAAPSRPVLDFEGNKVFSTQELLGVANKCLDRFAGTPYETEKLDYCLHLVSRHMHAKGYLQARLDKTLYQQTDNGSKALVPVTEGARFRVGKIEIENTKILAPAQIRDMIGLEPGDIADGEKISDAMFERVKETYGNLGYIQYTVEITPKFIVKEGADEGVADFLMTIEEGAQFKIRSIKFSGGDKSTTDLLRKELMVRDGDVYSSDLFSKSIIRMNNTGFYDRIDADRDVEYQTNEKAALLDLTIKLKKKIASAASP